MGFHDVVTLSSKEKAIKNGKIREQPLLEFVKCLCERLTF